MLVCVQGRSQNGGMGFVRGPAETPACDRHLPMLVRQSERPAKAQGSIEHPPCPAHSVVRCRTLSERTQRLSLRPQASSCCKTARVLRTRNLTRKILRKMFSRVVLPFTVTSVGFRRVPLFDNLPSPAGRARLRYSDIATCGVGHVWFAERLKAFWEVIRLACSAFPWHLPYGTLYGILFLYLAAGR
ncbi:hypothetical protein EDB83DRAFT_1088207 [Lactarius deliciosus]|nr:hypothetical protein EDB83DRAFT_1088207 [Lactarius deliciosus]